MIDLSNGANNGTQKVFISHASKNFRVSDEIRLRLEDMGIPCWIAPRDISPGSSYGEEITDSIQHCAAVVFVLTEEANASKAVANELEMAFRYQRVIIPVRLQPVNPASSLAFFINNSQWVDAYHTPLKKRVDEIARIVIAVRRGQPAPPPKPEQKTFMGSMERQLERMVRYKFVTLAIAVSLLGGLGVVSAMLSSKTFSRLNADQDRVNQDTVTFGLVNLAAVSESVADAKSIELQVTAYLNLSEPAKARVMWQAFAMAPGLPANPLDVAFVSALQAPGAQTFTLSVPAVAQRVTFCMTAIHPNLGQLHTAKWSFDIARSNGSVLVQRSGKNVLVPASVADCL